MKYLVLLLVIFMQCAYAEESRQQFNQQQFLENRNFECEKEYIISDWIIDPNNQNSRDQDIVKHFLSITENLRPTALRLIGYADDGAMSASVRAAERRLEYVENIVKANSSSLSQSLYSFQPKGMASPETIIGRNQRTVSFTLQACKDQKLRFAVARDDGVYHNVANSFKDNFFKIDGDNYPVELFNTAGSQEILENLKDGDADLGFATETAILKDDTGVQPVLQVWRDYIFFITTTDFVKNGNESKPNYSDLKKIIEENPDKICLGNKSSSTYLAAKKILKNLVHQDIKSKCNESSNNKEQLQRLGKGDYALVVMSIAYPANVLLDALVINDYSFVKDNKNGFRMISFADYDAREDFDLQKGEVDFHNLYKDFYTFYERNYLVVSSKSLKENNKMILTSIDKFFSFIKDGSGNKNSFLTETREILEDFCSDNYDKTIMDEMLKDQALLAKRERYCQEIK